MSEAEAERLLQIYTALITAFEFVLFLTDGQTQAAGGAYAVPAGLTLIVMGCCLVYSLFHAAGVLLEKRAAAYFGMVVFTVLLLLAFGMIHGSAGMAGTELPAAAEPGAAREMGTFIQENAQLLILGSLLLYLLVLLLDLSVWAKRVLTAALVLLAVILCVNGRQLPETACAALILLTVMEVLGACERKPLRWIACIGMLEILVLLLPVREQPIDWSFLYRIGNRIREGVETVTADTGYYFSGLGIGDTYSSGYSGLGDIGTQVSDSQREELYLQTDRLRGNLYLTGMIHGSSFSGEGIDSDAADSMEARGFLDLLQTLYEQEVTREEARLFGRVNSGEIEFGYLRTKDVIYPGGILRVLLEDGDELDENGASFDEMKRKGCHYSTTWLSLDYGSPYLEKIARKAGESLPGIVPQKRQAYASYEELSGYARRLYDVQLNIIISREEYDRWTQSPPDLTPYLVTEPYGTKRMQELADTLTAEAQTPYDACRAIEKYLRQYSYNRNVFREEGDNYIDEFLFRTGEGYCVHYASAMVMLLRLSGIPARYVEGYDFPIPGTKEDRYVVTGSNAHAWPEAWIGGLGWVPFEPTAIRRTSLDNTWKLYLPGDDPRFQGEAVRTGEEQAGLEKDKTPAIPESLLSQSQLEEERALRERQIVQARIRRARQAIRFAAFVSLGLAAYLVIILILIVWVRKRGYLRSDGGGKLERLLQDIRWLTEKSAGSEDGKDQDLRLLEEYVPLLPEELKEAAERTFSVYYRQRFGKTAALPGEIREAEELLRALRKHYTGKGWRSGFRAMQYLLHARAV